jgi:hypothetical protein
VPPLILEQLGAPLQGDPFGPGGVVRVELDLGA